MKKTAVAALGATFLALTATSALAQSSKAAWNYDDLVPLAHAVVDTDPSTPLPTSTDTSWRTVLTTYIKTPNAKELAIGVSLQCGIVTDTTVRSKNGVEDTSEAQGRIKVRVKVTREDGTWTYAQPNSGADLSGTLLAADSGITYCDRYQKLAAKFQGLNCFVDFADTDNDGVTNEILCLDPESLQLILKTLNAHHFNFLHANATSGVQKIEVQARAQAAVALGGSALGAAGAEAFAGAGVVSVETIRLVKDAEGSNVIEIN